MSISAILESTLVLPSVAPNMQLMLFYPVVFVFAKKDGRRRKNGRIIFSLPVVYGVISQQTEIISAPLEESQI